MRAVTGSAPWAKVGVEPGDASFVDLRSVTSSWDCHRRGIEAFPDNPCDPFGRPANYPRVWTRFGRVGLGEGDTAWLGVAIAVVFFAAALAVAGPLTRGEGVAYAAVLLAPATLLGVERGNVDLLMFVLVCSGLLLLRRNAWVGAAPIVLAAVLKLFPAFALAPLVRGRWRWTAAATSAAALAAYAVVTRNDIRALRHAIPRVVVDSYGAGVVVEAWRLAHVGFVESPAAVRWARLGVVALALLLAGAIALWGRARPAPDERRLDAFVGGAAIFLGTYVFGNNFDYRLVFLVLCVPQLLAWARHATGVVPGAGAALAALVATLWLSSAQPPLPFGLQEWYTRLAFPPEEILNWLLFSWLAAALAVVGAHALRRR